MARNTGLALIDRHEDGTASAVWGSFELRSAFQPIFAFGGGKLTIAAFEGLIRPFRDGEPLSPGTFFKAVPFEDRFRIETLTRTLHLLNAGACLDPATAVFVNFDPSMFTEHAVVETALRDMRLVLHQAGIDPARVVCEITEQDTASEDALFTFVYSLRAHGFRVAVDDYGAEHSDRHRIEALKPDIVKFDARWITRLMESGPGFVLLKDLVDGFSDRGIETVFEGIEEGWQLDLAEKSGASMVQGYVLARPQIAPTEFSIFTAAKDQPAAGAEDEAAGAAAPGHAPAPASRRPAFGRRRTAAGS